MTPELWAFREFLSKIPNINRGGCAIAALAMFRYGKRLGLNVHIMYLYQHRDDYVNNLLALQGECEPSNCMHATVVVDNEAWDSIKYVLTYIYDYKHFVPEEFVVRSLNIETHWSPEFDRKKYLPEIEAVLGEKLLNN